MPKTVRLTDKEQELIRKKCIEINRILVKSGMQPLRDSELIHKLLEKSIGYVRVSEGGEVYIDVV